jgi:hypothetical protein
VTQQDLSSDTHRLDNLVNMRFVRAYALVRAFIFDPELAMLPAHEHKALFTALEREISDAMGLPTTSLVGRLVDLGEALRQEPNAPGLAE